MQKGLLLCAGWHNSRSGLWENDSGNVYVDLGYSDAGHVLHRILDGFLQGFGNLRDVGSVLEVDADVDDRYVVIEADLDGACNAALLQKFLIGV